MKIGVWHHLPSGGGKRALHQQVRGLLDAGHEVVAWCPPTANRTYLPLDTMIPEHVVPLGTQTVNTRTQWLEKLFAVRTGVIARWNGMSEHARECARLINAAGLDVVLVAPCHWFLVPLIGPYLQIPSILYLQEPARDLYEARPRLPWIAEDDLEAEPHSWRAVRMMIGSGMRLYPLRVQAREEFHNIRAFTRVLVNSRFSRETVKSALGIDSTVCYLGVDTTRFQPDTAARQRFALCVGEFDVHKNPELILRALAASKTRPPLVWIANRVREKYVTAMQQLASSLGVAFTRKTDVSEADLIRHYQDAAVFVYAPNLEPFGFTPLEANACGTPVVAIAEGGIRETIEHGKNGLLVDSLAEMAAAVDQILASADSAAALGHEGRRMVETGWSLEASARRLEMHLIEIASTRRRQAGDERA